jgi:endonuclease/exonuclease/phosphatase family metal-dependent hydrolase
MSPVSTATLLCGLALSLPSLGSEPGRPELPPISGRFSLLTYNVAGLPELVSQSNPVANIPVISSLLNFYDVAVVQEDFAYHGALAAHALHPYQTLALVPNEKIGIGDGLNEFSRLPFSRFERVTWSVCNGTLSNGSDCFAPKGFTVATHELTPGVEIDLYNVHMDAGHSPGDVAARGAQAEQLLAYTLKRSSGRAIVVAGDTNMNPGSDQEVLVSFMKRAGLVDACHELACDNPARIDRVMYRGSSALDLRAARLAVDMRFVTRSGKDLSDHKAVGVVLEWRRAPH